MHKQLYVLQDGKPELITIRNYKRKDFAQLIDVQRQSFPPPFPEELWWKTEQLEEHVSRFPQGALCAEVDGKIIGSMTALIVSLADYGHQHSWSEITDDGYIRNHNPAGDTLYVVDICVVPKYRKAGIGKWLMQSMYETVVKMDLSSLLGGGRMPGYHKYAAQMSAQQYIDQVIAGEIKDPVITFLLRCGRMPIGIAAQYLEDEESKHYAAIMQWKNPFKSEI